jgi:integrase
MSKKTNNNQPISLNRGSWLSAKIYNDSKSGCSCGSNSWSYQPIQGLKDYEIPVCSKCGAYPSLFVIVATVTDEDGAKKRIKIRHTQEGQRLKEYFDVSFTLRNVTREINSGTFDVRRYESEESRESFLFPKVVEKYLAFHERKLARGELTPAGLKDKKTLIKNHLMPVFKELDVANISDRKIKDFFQSYTSSLRMRDKATSELKTILYFAMDELKKIQRLPIFPEIAASKMVGPDKFISIEKQRLIISKIENPTYRAAITLLAIYGLRPCEARSLKWKDIDLKQGIFHIQSHISLGEDIPGRKSQSSAVHSLPITDEFLGILKSLPRAINVNDYVFRGHNGGAIGGNVLTRAWNEACKLAKVKGVTLYQGTKHSTLSNLAKTASDAQLIRLSGHTNTKIIRRYAQASVEDIRKILG